ncbi:iron-sulfur cluster assembly scaffold protein [bacterium]|nr:iron-sulfur cluster assembly scaffold protein [bacterium]
MNDLDRAMKNLSRLLMGESSEQFTDLAMQLAHEPLNVGEMEQPDGLGYVQGECGDSMWIYLKMDGDTIAQATFITDGCGATLACGSAATDMVHGLTLQQAAELGPGRIIEYLGDLPASHHHCAVLTINSLKKAIAGISPHTHT